jgi:hypothetical protein
MNTFVTQLKREYWENRGGFFWNKCTFTLKSTLTKHNPIPLHFCKMDKNK